MAISKEEFCQAFRDVISSEFEKIPCDNSQTEQAFSADFEERMRCLFNQKFKKKK